MILSHKQNPQKKRKKYYVTIACFVEYLYICGETEIYSNETENY